MDIREYVGVPAKGVAHVRSFWNEAQPRSGDMAESRELLNFVQLVRTMPTKPNHEKSERTVSISRSKDATRGSWPYY